LLRNSPSGVIEKPCPLSRIGDAYIFTVDFKLTIILLAWAYFSHVIERIPGTNAIYVLACDWIRQLRQLAIAGK